MDPTDRVLTNNYCTFKENNYMSFRAEKRPCIHSQLHFQFKCIFAMLSWHSHLLFLVRYAGIDTN